MICNGESCVNTTGTLLGDKNYDQSCNEDKDYDESCTEDKDNTELPYEVSEGDYTSKIRERRDNQNVKDDIKHGSIKDSEIKNNQLRIESSSDNNKNNNQQRKEERKCENKNNVRERLNNNIQDDGNGDDDDTANLTVVACKDNDIKRYGTNNNINSSSAEKDNSDQENMGQAAPNCRRNIRDDEIVNTARIKQREEQENEEQNNRRNSGEARANRVEKSCKDKNETERYEDCVIVVDREDGKQHTSKDTGNISSKDITEKTAEATEGTTQFEACVVAGQAQSKDTAHEDIQYTDTADSNSTQDRESHRSEGYLAGDEHTKDNKQDTRKHLENIKKKYIAESHAKEGDDIERSWDCGVDTKNSKQNSEQKHVADSKDIFKEPTTDQCVHHENNVNDKDGNNPVQGLSDVTANSTNNNEERPKSEHAAQEKSAHEESNDHTQVIDVIQDSNHSTEENKASSASADKSADDIVEERQDATGKDDDSDQVDDDPLSDSGICYYKSKCLLKNQETMNSKEKVKVDESEPSWHEEAPFERRDVVVKKDRWVTDLYAVDSLLGRGKFGEVKKCRERRTGRQLAAKFIEVSGPQDRTDVINEVEIMKHLQHPRLLQLYDAFEHRDRFCLVIELVCGGELFERVINDDFILTEKACMMFMRQICDGVAFMHSENILHLDMKPENILCLTREGNRIKIIDFGLARKYNPKDDLRVLFGTPEFVAPEVANFDPIYPATDMWSVGVICYVLLSGLSPFMGETEAETLSNVTMARWDFNAEEFENISAEAKDFISKLLVKDPRKRISSAQCLEHQWLRRSMKRESKLPERSLSKKRLRKFVYRRKWQKAINAMLALRRMGVSLC